MRLPPPGDPTVRSVWVLRLSALGDVLLCEPAVDALARRYPEASVVVVTRAAYVAVFAHHPSVAACVTPAQARRMPAPDLAVDLHNRIETRRLAWRARRRVVWRKRRGWALLRGLMGQPLHRSFRGGPHQLRRIAVALGLELSDAPRMYVGADDAVGGAGVWSGTGPRIALVPGARHALKAWPAARYGALGRRLVDAGCNVRIVGGPSEVELLVAVAGAAGCEVVGAEVGIGRLAGLLAAADLVVGNDSGPQHVAAGVGTPALTLFGPTSPGRWGPLAGGHVVALDLPCAPCVDYGRGRCTRGGRPCLMGISVDRVYQEICGLIRI